MIYKDASIHKLELTYENYKTNLAEKPLHQEIIKTVRQYVFDSQVFSDEFIRDKVFYIAKSMYIKESAIMRYNSDSDVLSMILATHCLRYILENSKMIKGEE